MKRLPTKEAKEMRDQNREDINEMLTDQEKSHKEFGSEYFEWKTHEDSTMAAEQQIDDEVDFMEDPENFEKQY